MSARRAVAGVLSASAALGAAALGVSGPPAGAAGSPATVAAPGGTPGALQAAERRSPDDRNASYDGRFTFVRLRFDGSFGGGFGYRGRGGGALWAHDYPRAERNFARILHETTVMEPYLDGGNVLDVDDPELFRYPVAYICEVGYWRPNDAEVRALRAYLEKGGFLIVDDFRGGHWANFERQMRRVLPDARLRELDASHPVFHSFFEIESLDLAPPTYPRYRPAYYGVFEDDDPEGRLMVVANYNNDIGEYWEWSDRGFVPIDLSNEAYKLGVNYVVYAMTH